MSYSKQMLNTSLLFTSHCWGVAVCLATIRMGVDHFLWLFYSRLYIASHTNMHRFFVIYSMVFVWLNFLLPILFRMTHCAALVQVNSARRIWVISERWTQYVHASLLRARFMGPSWGPLGADRTRLGPIRAAWTSGNPFYQSVFTPVSGQDAIAHCCVIYRKLIKFLS